MSILFSIIGASSGVVAAAPVPLLFVYAGESNSTGLAPNSSALSSELLARPSVRILNESGAFEALHVGVNNQLSNIQFGITNPDTGTSYWVSTHGWELNLANQVEAGAFAGRTRVYLAKCGEGGSTIAAWGVGGTFSGIQPYALFLSRVNAAIALIQTATGQTPQIVVMWTLGINDKQSGTSTATFKSATKAIFNQMRTDLSLPNLPIIQLNFQATTGTDMTTYVPVVDAIASEMTNVFSVDSTGTTLIADGIHWNYAGAKTNGAAMNNLYISNYL